MSKAAETSKSARRDKLDLSIAVYYGYIHAYIHSLHTYIHSCDSIKPSSVYMIFCLSGQFGGFEPSTTSSDHRSCFDCTQVTCSCVPIIDASGGDLAPSLGDGKCFSRTKI